MKTRLLHRGFGIAVGLILTAVLALPMLHAESKPVLTVSMTSPGTLFNIAEKIATLTGTLDAFNDSAAPFKELKGINPKNPILLVFHAEGNDFKDPLLFLPITDLDKVELPGLDMLLTQAKKESEGKYLINSPVGAFILTQKKGYLVASSESSDMSVPDDPAKFLKGLEEYSLGIRIDFENTSAEAIQMLLAPLQLIAGMQGGEQVMQAFEQINQSVELMCKECRSMTIGLTMDPKTGNASLQTKTVAKKGSFAEKQLAALKGAKTIFGGFLGDENAVVSFSSVGMGIKDSTQMNMLKGQIDQLVAGLIEQVEENAEEDEDIQLVETVAASLKKIYLATLAQDKTDFGFSLGNDGTFAWGMNIAETKELDVIHAVVMKRLAKLAASNEKLATVLTKLKMNYATVDGFQLSSFVLPLNVFADKPGFSEFFADKTFYLYRGLKDDALVLFGGFDSKSEDRLKAAIAAMKKPVVLSGNGKVSMQQLGRLLKNFQVDQIDPQAAVVVKTFLDAGADANITMSQTVVKDTLEAQVSVDGKIWEALARIVKAAAE